MGRYSSKPGKREAAPTRRAAKREENAGPLYGQEALASWLRQVRFKKCLFGGVRESDVWKKIGELNSLYEAALSAERARYDALLEAQRREPPSWKEKVGDEGDG